MEFTELAEKRYSCRKLSDRLVPENLILKVVDAGLLAPTAVNRQPFRISWMHSPEAQEMIRQVTGFTFGAKDFLVLGCCREEAWTRDSDGLNFCQVDGAIAATHMLLQIEALGLSTTWVGYFDAPKLKELCPRMKDLELIAIFPIGYAAEDAVPAPKHFIRKSREEMLDIL